MQEGVVIRKAASQDLKLVRLGCWGLTAVLLQVNCSVPLS
jgi:hypothetical protein